MARIQDVSNLVQGVSQQAVQQRRDSQCEAQFDCLNSAGEGVVARPPTELVKLFAARDWALAYFTEIVRDETNENYLVACNASVPKAFNLSTGTDCTVTNTAADTYLSNGSPSDFRDLVRVQTIEDTTIIAQRNNVCAMVATLSPNRLPEALVFVRSGAYSATYTIILTGPATLSASYTTTRSDVPATEDTATTNAIAAGLVVLLNGVSGYTATLNGSTIHITRGDAADFNISTRDGNGDEFMMAFKGKVQNFSRLPARGFAGMILEVSGESRTVSDNFFVKFTGSPGYWEESIAPATQLGMLDSSLPHLLVNTGLNAFTWKKGTYSDRVAGDSTTSKNPGFVGKRIRDVFYHANRLAFLTSANVVWSKTQFPYTFFADTVQTILATAPVDVKVVAGGASRGTTTLDYAVTVDEGLYLWSRGTQFRVASGTEAFKQDSVEIKNGTAYEYAPGCDPLPLGSYLFFASEAGPYATIRSLQYSAQKVVGDTDISAHIPAYVPSGIRGLAASDTLRQIYVRTDGDPQSLYLYNFLANQQEYVQSAWNKWRLPGGSILWAGIKDNFLRIVQQRPEGLALLRVNLTPKAVDGITGATYLTRLDMRVRESQVTSAAYDSATDTYHFTLPYTPTGPEVRVIVAEDVVGGFTRGHAFVVVSVVGAVVTVEGDMTGYKFYCGQRISSERTESEFFVRGPDGVVPTDRLVVNRFYIYFADTGYTRIEVGSPNKANRVYEWEARTLGNETAQTDTPLLDDASFSAPVSEESKNATITLINDSFLPSYWELAGYEYDAITRGTR